MYGNNGNWMVAHPKQMYASAKLHHRNNTWNLNQHGLMVRHDYTDMTPESLSWWDDVGFIFGKRRIMVWWLHPRMVYKDRLDEMATQQCAEKYPKEENWLMKSEPIRRKVKGGNRVKTVLYRMLPISTELQNYYDNFNSTLASLAQQDHGWEIQPSLKSTVLDWCQGINLVFPVEIRCEDDLRLLRDVVERHLRGDRSVLSGYSAYTFTDWQSDQKTMASYTSESLL
jgi:hypothetical protein